MSMFNFLVFNLVRSVEILVLWNIPGLNDDQIAAIQNYELFGKQENPSNASANKWVKLASMKSLPLPMECRLSKVSNLIKRKKFFDFL